MSIRPKGIYSSYFFLIQKFSFKKMYLNMSSAKWWPFCLCLNVLNKCWLSQSLPANKVPSDWQRQQASHQQRFYWRISRLHYNDVIMGAKLSLITDVLIVYSTVCSGEDQRKHQRSAVLAFSRGNWWLVNFPQEGQERTRIFFHLMTSSCYSEPFPLRIINY